MNQVSYDGKGKEKKQKNKNEKSSKMEIRKYDANILDNIGRDGDLLSLTDLWKAAGSP